MKLPDGVLAFVTRGPDWAAFVERLPVLADVLFQEWGLKPDGEPKHGYCALVLPVRTTGGRPAMLKIAFPDDESEHEHLALQHWHGNGAVQLLRADPHRGALLLERLYDEDLTAHWDLDACEIVAGLYRQLHVPAIPQLRTLSSYVERWNGDLSTLDRKSPLPRRLVEQAMSLGKDFVKDERTDGLIIHGDLHYENVLAAPPDDHRQPWLAIDPKPMSGDPHYEISPMLWNRWEEVVASGNVRDAVRRRFHTLVDAAEFDEDRARDWVIVRMVHNAMWCLEDAVRARRGRAPVGSTGLSDLDRARLTMCIAIAKAVQD